MELWNDREKKVTNVDMEQFITVLECFSEDELYFTHDVEIEQIERIIQLDGKTVSEV